MATSMTPSSVSIRPLRTEGRADIATVWFAGSWVRGRPPDAGTTAHVRGMMLWRKETDGRWRVAVEHIS